MKIAIKFDEDNNIMYIDKNLRQEIPYTSPPYNFTIIEIDDKYSDCINLDFNTDFTFNIEKYNKRKQSCINQEKMIELTNWFDTTYRYKIEKYTRLIALEKPDDDGISAETKLKKLYEEAEEKRYKIQELEKNK